MFKEREERARNGLIWLRIGTGSLAVLNMVMKLPLILLLTLP
jgi:hypothetical protein